MKSVLLIRHTKSDWDSSPVDFERPIRTDRHDDARIVAKEILLKGFQPHYVAASPARRTLQTAQIISEIWNYDFSAITHDKSLYESSATEILKHLQKLDRKIPSAVIICHNPSITDFINKYSDDAHIDNFPTTGAALIDFNTNDWQSTGGGGKLQWFLKPKDLRKKTT